MSPCLELSRKTGYLVATLQRPKALNALSSALCDDLVALAEAAESDRELCCIVLTGAGRGFCSGADLKARDRLDGAARWRYVEDLNKTMRRLELTPVPVLAAINGFALGGGLELALACDYRIAAASATFGMPEARWGIMAGGGIVRSLRDARPSAAAIMTYTAERYAADQALAWGFVDEVVADDALMTRAEDLARRIARNAPLALRAAKALRLGLQKDFTEKGMTLAEAIRRPLDDTEDCLEGLKAFAEKREPDFKGR